MPRKPRADTASAEALRRPDGRFRPHPSGGRRFRAGIRGRRGGFVSRLTAAFLCVGLVQLSPGHAFSQQGDWIYDIFVKKCREAGGSPASSLQEYKQGKPFRCDQGGSGQSRSLPAGTCEKDAKENVDWVFRDKGAKATYAGAFNRGLSPFDSVVYAQGHNPSAQRVLKACRSWVEAYLATLGASRDGPSLSDRKLGAQDCRCISVIPIGANSQGRNRYRVSNSCDAMQVSVHFIDAVDGFSSWGSAGLLANGSSSILTVPDWKLPSIAAVQLRDAASSQSCVF
jgi:hypothetical protein